LPLVCRCESTSGRAAAARLETAADFGPGAAPRGSGSIEERKIA
jgi:hypothetical protein